LIKMRIKRSSAWLLAVALIMGSFMIQPAGFADAAAKSYTVTANLYVPGELNTQLPGVTAYLTNGNNPLGLGGYDAVAPTTPVADNASLTVAPDGTMTLEVAISNPVFTLQKIGGSSNATIAKAVRDSESYATLDGSVSRKGRITRISVELNDRSGVYTFTECIEFPTLLGVDWTVPLTLEADLSGVPVAAESQEPPAPQLPVAGEAPGAAPAPTVPASSVPGEAAGKPSGTVDPEPLSAEDAAPAPSLPAASTKVNYDKLNAVIATVDGALASAIVSEDGSDVGTADVWATPGAAASLRQALKLARASLSGADQTSADKAAESLAAAYAKFIGSRKSGARLDKDEEVVDGRELAAGTYTVSANIWFNKADTGLPLNPHITNGTFPPYNPVENNAVLTVAEDGSARVTIPVTIQDKVLTVRSIAGLQLTDIKTSEENGAITEITVDLGALDGGRTVVAWSCSADIQMGNLAMSISGLDKDHTWPATFELNLSGVATKDGGSMPVVELALMNVAEAGSAMAAAGGLGDTDSVGSGTAGSSAAQAEIEASGEADSGAQSRPEAFGAADNGAQSQAEASRSSLYLALAAAVVIAAAVAAWIWTRRRKQMRSK